MSRTRRIVERWSLRLRGVNPSELEEELQELDAAKRRRERERREAEERARRVGLRVMGRRDV